MELFGPTEIYVRTRFEIDPLIVFTDIFIQCGTLRLETPQLKYIIRFDEL